MVSHRTLIFLGGVVWLAIGIFLLTLGLNFIISSKGGSFNWVFFEIFIALFVGNLKGRFILGKSVKRQVRRILELPNPTSLKHIYSKGYYFLIGGMMLLGMSLRILPISVEIRGVIDVAIGAALLQGALLYIRCATTQYNTLIKEKQL